VSVNQRIKTLAVVERTCNSGPADPVYNAQRMPKPKITKAEKLVNEQMLAVLEWASHNPGQWHSIGSLEATKQAVLALEKRGVLQVNLLTNVYRLKATPKK